MFFCLNNFYYDKFVYGREDMQVFRFQYFPSYATGQIRKLNVKKFQGKVFSIKTGKYSITKKDFKSYSCFKI